LRWSNKVQNIGANSFGKLRSAIRAKLVSAVATITLAITAVTETVTETVERLSAVIETSPLREFRRRITLTEIWSVSTREEENKKERVARVGRIGMVDRMQEKRNKQENHKSPSRRLRGRKEEGT
jgi:hypothetical protein